MEISHSCPFSFKIDESVMIPNFSFHIFSKNNTLVIANHISFLKLFIVVFNLKFIEFYSLTPVNVLFYISKNIMIYMKKHKILTIASSQNDVKKILPTLREFKKNKIIVFELGGDLLPKIKNYGFIYKNLNDYKSLQKKLSKVNEKAIKWIKKWSNKKINKKIFKELVTFDNINLWWFVDAWFYQFSMSHFYSIDEIIKNIEIIDTVIKKENPDKIIIIDDKKLTSKIVKILAGVYSIQLLIIPDFISSIKFNVSRIFLPFVLKLFKGIKGNLRKFATKLNYTLKPVEHRKNKILMITHPTYQQTSINPETKKTIKEDIILGPIIRELKKIKRNEILLIDTDPFPTFRLDFLFKKNYKHIEGYSNSTIKKKITEEKKKLLKIWEDLKKEKSFIDSLKYQKIPIFELLENKFSELFSRKFVESVKYIELMKRVVQIENPNIIVILDEYGLYGRAAVVAGKLNSIPTLGIQHGIIEPHSFGYFHTKDEILTRNFLDFSFCPIPDKTAVSGEYYKKILTKYGSYSADKIIVTGQPKYDILAHVTKIYNKKKICDQLKISPDKKIIVFASQPHPEHVNEFLFRSLFKAVKEIPNTQLVIKLHPNEYDKSLHERIAREVNIDVVITKDVNLFELLNACDILMTISSTVALEAMILGKPVIIVDLKTKPDETSFVKSDAAIGVHESEDIKPAIVKVLNDKKIRKKLESNMKGFVYDHAYKIDGSASKRIVKLINRMIKNK